MAETIEIGRAPAYESLKAGDPWTFILTDGCLLVEEVPAVVGDQISHVFDDGIERRFLICAISFSGAGCAYETSFIAPPPAAS